MATKNNNSVKNSQTPAWLGGGNDKGNNQVVQRVDNNKSGNNVLGRQANKPQDEVANARQESPAWLNAVIGAALGATNNPVVGDVVKDAAMGPVLPQYLNGKPNDQLVQKGKPYDQLVNRMLAARSDQLRPAGPGTEAPPPDGSTSGYSGFGSRYGGNWGGGGGGGWGGGGGGYDNTSAWMRYLLNLYSWNIK